MKSARKIRALYIGRKVADTKLRGKANVVGTCLGLKEAGNQRTGEIALKVFVSGKVPVDALDVSDLIPQEARRHGMDLPTDVVEIRGLRREGRFGTLCDGMAGTLGCFAAESQTIHGLTCGHCAGWLGGDSYANEDVLVEYPDSNNYIGLGKARKFAVAEGLGIPDNFGEIDAAIVELSDEELADLARTRTPLETFQPPLAPTKQEMEDLLLHTTLNGNGSKSGSIQGVIDGIWGQVEGIRFDLSIVGTNPSKGITTKGDSGMVWVDAFRRAYGIHTLGANQDGAGLSTRTFSFFAHRVSDAFGVSLLSRE